MREKWEEVFDELAFRIAALICASTPCCVQVELAKGWLRSVHIDEMLKRKIGDES